MAWSSTVKQIVGNMVNSSYLNTYHRDRLDFLSTHTHTGAAGDGSVSLALATVTIDSSSAPSTPAAGKLVMWVDSETVKVKDSSGTGTAVSLEGHTH